MEVNASRFNVIFYLAIVLVVFQFFTFVALMVLRKSFLDLKKNILKYKDSLPMVNISPPSTQNISPPAYPAETPSIAIGNTQKPEFNEVIEIMPTPDPERRRIHSSTVAIEKTPKKQFEQKSQTLPLTSFSALSRDSGIGFSSDRNQSTSSESMKEVARRSRELSVVSQERVSVHEKSRTGSNSSSSSRGSKTVAPRHYGLQASTLPEGIDDDDESSHLSRLHTMAIEMIDVQPKSNEKRYKRASQILNERLSMTEEKFEDNASFVNRGYSDASHSSQRSVPLASEEGSLASDLQNVFDDNNNGDEEEKYENQEIVEKHRLSMGFESSKM